MTKHEKIEIIDDLLDKLQTVATIEELLTLSGKFYYELFSSFDAEEMGKMQNEVDMFVQALFVPVAKNITHPSGDIGQQIKIAKQEVRNLLDDSFFAE